MRSTITTSNVSAATATICPRGRVLDARSSTMPRTCMPIRKNTAFSSRNWMVAQLVRSNTRDVADWMTGALCPSSRPATTTASTPDASISSAGKYAIHGVSSETATSVRSSSIRRRTSPTTSATAMPMAAPPTAENTKSRPTCQAVTVPAIAAIAVRNATSAVASLTRLSPSRTVTTRRGIPIRRAIAVAATASGGATTAPSAKAGAHPIGSSHHASAATPTVVNTTSPTDNRPIGRRFCPKSISEVRRAAAYSSGGSSPISTNSGVSSTLSTNGRYDATNPAASKRTGDGNPIRRANDAKPTTVAAMNTT
jgi:hypothetical protein